jgi:NAD(P)-dependent dehydrogenase (short-subunit alcohol dehydrogenase family)
MLLAQESMRFWRRQRSGSIVNLASRVWLSGAGPAYTASKAGLVGLTRSLAVQLGPLGVTVNAVAPSYLSTGFNFQGQEEARRAADAQHIRLGVLDRLATPEDVAGAIAFLASEESRFITGEVIHVCGGAQLAARPESAAIADGSAT